MSALASAATWNDLINYIPTLVTSAGIGGLWLLAYLKDWIIQPKVHKEVCDDRDQWKKLYLEEAAAHRVTRDALVTASQRQDAATDTSRLAVSFMQALHQQAQVIHEAPPAAAIPPPPAAGGGVPGA